MDGEPEVVGVPHARDEEVLRLVQEKRLFDTGVGYIAHTFKPPHSSLLPATSGRAIND
jgi:hypothetical protein